MGVYMSSQGLHSPLLPLVLLYAAAVTPRTVDQVAAVGWHGASPPECWSPWKYKKPSGLLWPMARKDSAWASPVGIMDALPFVVGNQVPGGAPCFAGLVPAMHTWSATVTRSQLATLESRRSLQVAQQSA